MAQKSVPTGFAIVFELELQVLRLLFADQNNGNASPPHIKRFSGRSSDRYIGCVFFKEKIPLLDSLLPDSGTCK